MCGIVGYVGSRHVTPVLLTGLQKLEYRGYDSAGVAVLTDGHVETIRAVGNLEKLREALRAAALDQNGGGARQGSGIGHTRWATHGAVTEENAHPHSDTSGRIHVVVNGIIDNYLELKGHLAARGACFSSDTDAEVIAHLVADHYDGDLAGAVRGAAQELRGRYAFVAMGSEHPGVLVGTRRDTPLIIGRGSGEQFIASAIPAFLEETRSVQYLGDDEVVVLSSDGAQFETFDGRPVAHEVTEVEWDADGAEKQGYETFMLKEIHEQPDALAETLCDRTASGDSVDLGDLGTVDDTLLRRVRRVVIVACGTSYHAGLVGSYAIEEWARVMTEVQVASEYRYRHPVVGPDDLVIGITQSGETADTLAAMRLARECGATVLAVTNIMGSQATRDADGVLYTRAGLEVGVAATKTFVTQVAVLFLLALRLAEVRGTLDGSRLTGLIGELRQLPSLITRTLDASAEAVRTVAYEHQDAGFFLYLGRHVGVPVAHEGALKLKEIAYIPTDAYAAGEMKHGPIALLDDGTPVVVLANDSPLLDKLVANLQEVRTRGARVIAVASEPACEIADLADELVTVPRTDPIVSAIVDVVPLQLLAYEIARARGLDVDQPRNLAKTVTVE